MSGEEQVSPGDLVDAFMRAAVRGPFDYPACHHFEGQGERREHVVLGFAIHGNEFGTLPAALELQGALTATPPLGPVTLLLGNVEAIREGVRFLDEDFNRVFTFDRPAESRERRRAEQVRPILDAADVFLDFHQTQTPTEVPFWTFPFEPNLALYARAIGGAERVLTRAPGRSFSPGLRCLDEYVRDRGRIGLTLEVGARGLDDGQAARTLASARNLMAIADSLAVGGSSLDELASRAPALSFFETGHIVEARGKDLRLRPGLTNWLPLRSGDPLSEGASPALLCPFDGCALFPKYPAEGEDPPPELLRIARPVVDPARAFGT